MLVHSKEGNNMIGKSVDLGQLSSAQNQFLAQFQGVPEGKGDIPIYVKDGGEYHWVPGVHCPYGERSKFENAPEDLFLSGAAIFALVKQGIAVVPDRRNDGCYQATAQGWAVRGEGGLPKKTALRELSEEVVAYTVSDILTMQNRTEIVPKGMSPRGSVPAISVDLPEHAVYGELSLLRVNENGIQGIVEFVYVWDLRGLGNDLCIIHDDDLPWGGFMGSNPVVLDTDGNPVGVFSGQQGFLPFGLAPHSVIRNSWEALSNYWKEMA